MRRGVRWLAAGVLAAVLALPGGAMAAQSAPGRTHLQMTVPDQAKVGEETTVQLRLTDQEGQPVSGAQVSLEWLVDFLGTEGKVVLGTGATDLNGEALITFRPTGEDNMVLRARFAGDATHRPSGAVGSLSLLPGGPLVVPKAGVRVPGINVGLLVAILSAVWGTYLVVALLVGAIALRGGGQRPAQSGRAR